MRALPTPLVILTLVVVGASLFEGCVADVKAPPYRDDDGDPIDEPRPGNPGGGRRCEPTGAPVPVLPRTSTHEFQRFVSDLMGTPVDDGTFAQWTPLAKVFGFDSMTEAVVDAQTFDAMFDTTLVLAEQLSQSPRVTALCPAPVPTTPACALHGSYDANAQFSGTQGQDCWNYLDHNGAALPFNAGTNRYEGAGTNFIWATGMHPGSTAHAMRRLTVAVDGAMRLRGAVTSVDGGGGDGIVFAVRHRGQVLVRETIANGSGLTVDDLLPRDIIVRKGETIDFIVERNGNNSFDTTGVTLQATLTPTPSTAGLTWESCTAPAVIEIGHRAFRRPLSEAELVDFKRVFDETVAAATTAGRAVAFYDGLIAALQAVLLSPNVHYKPELVPEGPFAEHEHHRTAARLALMFQASFPDDALRSLADAQALSQESVIRAEAERLLALDPSKFVKNFAGQWLDFRSGFGGAAETSLERAMRDEAQAVFAAVLADGLPPERLIDPGFTVVNDELAAHYGLELPGEGVPARVVTDARGGIMAQGHMLTKTARGTDFKRVINRGLFTLTRAMCLGVPMLDPATREEIANSGAQADPSVPLAERMQIHRESSSRCIACHGQMDPLGLALERYDSEAQYREHYEDGSAIDNDFAFNELSMRNPAELTAYLSTSGDFQLCAAEKLFTYGLHRAPNNDEFCVIDQLAAEGDSLKDMAINAFIASRHLTSHDANQGANQNAEQP